MFHETNDWKKKEYYNLVISILTRMIFDRSRLLKSTKEVPGISGNLMIKSKLPPLSGASLETVESHP